MRVRVRNKAGRKLKNRDSFMRIIRRLKYSETPLYQHQTGLNFWQCICLEAVVAVVAVAAEGHLGVHHCPWDLRLLISRICPEKLLPCTRCVNNVVVLIYIGH